MGHLTRIANCIVHSTDKGPNSALVQQLIKGKSFKQFSLHLCGNQRGEGLKCWGQIEVSLHFRDCLTIYLTVALETV